MKPAVSRSLVCLASSRIHTGKGHRACPIPPAKSGAGLGIVHLQSTVLFLPKGFSLQVHRRYLVSRRTRLGAPPRRADCRTWSCLWHKRSRCRRRVSPEWRSHPESSCGERIGGGAAPGSVGARKSVAGVFPRDRCSWSRSSGPPSIALSRDLSGPYVRQIDPVQTFRELSLLFQQGVLAEETPPEKEDRAAAAPQAEQRQRRPALGRPPTQSRSYQPAYRRGGVGASVNTGGSKT